MIIYVQGIGIETKDIFQIVDIENKYGFVIHLIEDRTVEISESKDYRDSRYEMESLNNKYDTLKQKIIEKWNEDKIDYIVLNL